MLLPKERQSQTAEIQPLPVTYRGLYTRSRLPRGLGALRELADFVTYACSLLSLEPTSLSKNQSYRLKRSV